MFDPRLVEEEGQEEKLGEVPAHPADQSLLAPEILSAQTMQITENRTQRSGPSSHRTSRAKGKNYAEKLQGKGSPVQDSASPDSPAM